MTPHGVTPAGQPFGLADTRGSGGGQATSSRSVTGLTSTSRGFLELEPPEQKIVTAGETHPLGCEPPEPDRTGVNSLLLAVDDPRPNCQFIVDSGVFGSSSLRPRLV